MKAIIVAGGYGKRLRPLTDSVPKPMIKLAGKPILEHTIELLKNNGVTSIIIALCYLPNVITEYFGDGTRLGVNISYTFEDPETPLGTAGAINPAREFISPSESFIVTYADVLRVLDIKQMIEAHEKNKSIVTMNVYKHRKHNFKSEATFDENHELTQFTEREKVGTLEDGFVWSNGSFYICTPEIFDHIYRGERMDFAKDIFPKLLSLGKKISVFPTDGYFIDIGTMETLAEAEKGFNSQEKDALQ